MSEYIGSIGTGGHPDGGVYAVNPAGHIVSTKLVPLKGGGVGLKNGWRAATRADLDAATQAEAKRAKKGS